MALNMYEQTGHTKYDIREYVCDTASDINNLPVDIPMGSQAFVISTGAIYILGGDQTWEEFIPAVGGGGSSSLNLVVLTSGQYNPTTGVPTITGAQANTIYLAPNPTTSTSDLYIEWVYVNSNWEKFGSAAIDLSSYATKEELGQKQNTLVSGTNIKTVNNTSLLGSGNVSIPTTTLTDNAAGGVDVAVGSTTKTLAKESEVTALGSRTTTIENNYVNKSEKITLTATLDDGTEINLELFGQAGD